MFGKNETNNADLSQPKEWQLVEKLASASLVEQRRSRRWGIVFKSLTFAYLFALLFYFGNSAPSTPGSDSDGHTALVDVKGVIADSMDANADTIVTGLRNAFEDEKTKAVILRINSPV